MDGFKKGFNIDEKNMRRDPTFSSPTSFNRTAPLSNVLSRLRYHDAGNFQYAVIAPTPTHAVVELVILALRPLVSQYTTARRYPTLVLMFQNIQHTTIP